MFTIDQIKDAHSKVKSGADFPNYIQDLIKLGVSSYETHVSDGHTLYYGHNDYKTQSESKYSTLEIQKESNKPLFQKELKEHQEGKTDFMGFCNSCASNGIEKWIVVIPKMTCTYYDKNGTEILVESIPGK